MLFFYIPRMNISKFLVLCFLATTFAFAQVSWEEKPAPSSESPISSESLGSSDSSISLEAASSSSSSEIAVALLPPALSSSSVEETKPAAPESKTIFDFVRGHAYNPYSTVGAASSVGDLITIPSDINGQKFFYVSPTDRLGYAAFPLGGGTAMLGLDNSSLGSPAALVLGYANSLFGFALDYSVAKNWMSNDSIGVKSARATSPGDNIGLYVSMPLGSATLYANANWLTYGLSSYVDYDGSKTTSDSSYIAANIGLTDNSGSLGYDIYLNAYRYGSTKNENGEKLVGKESFWDFGLNFNIGYAALQSSVARIIVGSNNSLILDLYDKAGDMKSDYVIAFYIAPNILGEAALSDNLLAFAGAKHILRLIAGDGDRDDNTSALIVEHANGTWAFAGLRYQKTHWALESQVSANMFSNPFGGFNGSNMLAGFGGFIYF
jgi:hypothetical protein